MANIKSLQADNITVSNELTTTIIKSTSYEDLPIASDSILGIVKIDNTTIKINPFGQLYSVISTSSGEIPQEFSKHLSDNTIHLNQEQIYSLIDLKNHLTNNETHLTTGEKTNVSNLGAHYNNSSIHLIGETLTNFNVSYNHAIDSASHISAIERETLNTVTNHFNNTEIHLSQNDRDKVDSTVKHIDNADIHISINDRTLLDTAIRSTAEFSAHMINDTIHFTDSEKVDIITKANMAEEAKTNADAALSLVQNVAVSKYDANNHEPNKILITDNSGAIIYHPTISADKLGTGGSTGTGDGHTHTNKDTLDVVTSTKITNWNSAYTHSTSAHAPTNAQVNVQSDWNASTGDAFIKNKPTSLPANGGNADTIGGRKITVSQTAPSNPNIGDIWISW